MGRSPEEFKKAALEKDLYQWSIHDCSLCGYDCGFIFDREGNVSYDSGCYCSRQPVRPSSWEEVADHYNRNAGSPDKEERAAKNPRFRELVEDTNEFWFGERFF
jgi:hypothetical protein